jgi:NADH:ubiquinone oxidoreductase subunit D
LNYKNVFVFLCLVIRPAPDDQLSPDVESKTPAKGSVKKGSERAAVPTGDEYSSIVQVRPRLDKWKMQHAHTSFFFDRVYQLMHFKEESPQLYAILRSLTGELARIHPSCYQVFLILHDARLIILI